MNKNIFGVILAGGGGSRLWPLSREMYPKQLLKLTGENSLFQSTFLRLNDLIPAKNIITITNDLHLNEINTQLEEINQNHNHSTIGEPVGRNTAPAIGLATLFIQNLQTDNSDPVIFVTPSDHLIQNNETFLNAVKEGIELAENGYIVTFGIKPSKPETGYGYIKIQGGIFCGEGSKKCHPDSKNCYPDSKNCGGHNRYKVEEFKEKPDFETAKKYLEAGTYFWNSGIFMFKASTMLEEMRLHCPDVLAELNKLDLTKDFIDKEAYQAIPSISIDYAVMEKSDKIALIACDCGWNDLGSWEAIYDAMEKDSDKNYTKGDVITIDTEGSYVYSSSRLISTIGVKDLVIIETEDAILVCDKSRTQDVKTVFEKLKKKFK